MGTGTPVSSEARRRGSALDPWVPWLLLFGAMALGVGWIVAVVGLWVSDTWSFRDKLLGTLIWPGGLVTVYIGLQAPTAYKTCGSGAGCVTHGYMMPVWLALPVIALAVGLPIAVAVHLARTRRRMTAASTQAE